jgi:HEAT repeat protein
MVQVQLLEALREWRVPESIPLARSALQASASEVWRASLDVLAAVGNDAAVEVLRDELARSTGNKREWLEEALRQFAGPA